MKLQFRDKTKYLSFNYPLSLIEIAPIELNGEKRRVVEFYNLNSDKYEALMPLHKDIKDAEANNDHSFLARWRPYQKGQKRIYYSKDQFNELFKPLNEILSY
jgi:hypothetical protein